MINKQIGGDLLGNLPRITSPLQHIPRTNKKPKQTESNSDLLKNLTTFNQQLTQNLKTAESERDLLLERVDALEEQILKDQDFISSLRSRISNLSESAAISQNISPRVEAMPMKTNPKVIAAVSEISPESVAAFFQNKPILLLSILGETIDVQLKDIFSELQPDCISPFITYLMKQLDRFNSVYDGFKHLTSIVQDVSFSDVLSEVIRKTFKSNVCYIFTRDLIDGEFVTHFGMQTIQISLKGTKSTIASAAEIKKPIILLDPQKYPEYSPSLDPLFNPGNLPEILIPVNEDAVFLVIKTDVSQPDFSNEDIILGKIIAEMYGPLMHENIIFETMMREVEYRRSLRLFEKELAEKTKLEILIPFLMESLSTLICANNVIIYIVAEKNFITFDVEDQRLVQKTLDKKGTPLWVCNNQHHILSECLDESTPLFDLVIDSWAKGKPYAAYPIYDESREIRGVIAVGDKIGGNKFNSWDCEFMESISVMLMLVLPQCLNNLVEKKKSDGQTALENLPLVLAKTVFETFEKENAEEEILRKIQELVNCEWISYYSKVEGEDPKRVMTMCSGKVVDQIIAGVDFVNKQYELGKPLVEPDVTQIEGFDIVGDYTARSLISLTNARHKNKIFIIALNALSTAGQFDNAIVPVLDAATNYLIYAEMVKEKNTAISDAKSGSIIMDNAFKVTSAAIQDPKPFSKLLEVFAQMTQLQFYAVYRVRFQHKVYEQLVGSEGVKNSKLDSDDLIFKKVGDFFFSADFENSEIAKSKISTVFPPFKAIVVQKLQENLYLICAGDEYASNYQQLFSYFSTSLKSFSAAYLPPQPTANYINFYSSKLLDSDVTSRLFVSTSLDDQQKTECVLKMFINLGTLSALGNDLEKLTNFVKLVREEYKNVPFHNFDHALDFTQFVYACLVRNKFGECFTFDQRAALLIAALCHDVGHRGLNTEFYKNKRDVLITIYGNDSPLEKYHAQKALQLAEKAGLELHEKAFLVNCIVATDMTRHNEFMEHLSPLNGGFRRNEVAKISLVAFLLMKCGNIANTTRPFYFAKDQATKIIQEYKEMAKVEKNEGLQQQLICEKKNTEPIDVIELSFINKVCLPLVSLLEIVLPDFKDFKVQVEDNKEQWEKYKKE